MRPKHMVLVLCIAFLMECIAVFAAVSPPIKDLRLDVSPPNIQQGFTKHLAVNCTIDYSLAPHFGNLIELILSKETGTSGVYTDIGSISTYGNQQVDVKDSLGADVKGSLSATGVSFISYEWDDPTIDVEGNYRCEALGMDQLGHPRDVSDTASIEEKMVNLSMALNKVNEVQGQLYQCQQQKSNASSHIDDCSTYKDNLTIVTDELNQCKNSTSKLADCERDTFKMAVLINQCSTDKNTLTVEISDLKDKENNLTTLLSACSADRANMSTSLDKCNQDLKDNYQIITQSFNNTSHLNANLSQCSQDKNNLTTVLNDCESKGNVLKSELDQCINDKNNVSLLLNQCKTLHQPVTTTPSNDLIAAVNCQNTLVNANLYILNLTQKITDLQHQIDTNNHIPNYKSQYDLLRAAFMQSTFEVISSVYNGHVYCLSHPVTANITHSHNTCQSFGGTLAEINNDAEYNFVNHFCKNSGVHAPTRALLGATDLHYTRWHYFSSGRPVDYTHWAVGQPNGYMFENCMFLLWNNLHNIHDAHCFSKDEPARFICELPQ